MIFHEGAVSRISGASLLHTAPNISFKMKTSMVSKEAVLWWVTVLPPILSKDLVLLFLLASCHTDSHTVLNPKHSGNINYIFMRAKYRNK